MTTKSFFKKMDLFEHFICMPCCFFSNGLILAFFSSNFFQAPQDTKPNYVEPRLLFPILQGKLDKWHQNKTWTCHKPCRSLMRKSREKETTWNAKCPISLGNFTPKTSNYCLKNRALGFPGTTKKNSKRSENPMIPPTSTVPPGKTHFWSDAKNPGSPNGNRIGGRRFRFIPGFGRTTFARNPIGEEGTFCGKNPIRVQETSKDVFSQLNKYTSPKQKTVPIPLANLSHLFTYIYIYQGECVCKVAKRCGWRLSILSQY